MENILRIIKTNFVLLFGVGLFIYGLFSFMHGKYCSTEAILSLSRKCTNPATFYYYDDTTLIFLVVGAILLVVGLLSRK